MADKRCYKSSNCTNTAEICNLVKNGKDCKLSCCEKPNCNAVVQPDNSNTMHIASSLFIGIFVAFALVLKI